MDSVLGLGLEVSSSMPGLGKCFVFWNSPAGVGPTRRVVVLVGRVGTSRNSDYMAVPKAWAESSHVGNQHSSHCVPRVLY